MTKSTRRCRTTWRTDRTPVMCYADRRVAQGALAVKGSGKRGGVRVIYYRSVAQAQIRMILIYRKGVKDNLTPKEKAVLRKMNAEW